MKRKIEILFVFLFIILLMSCASTRQATEWKYEKKSIHIHLIGEPRLNLYQGIPHTLTLCAYQLSDPNAFNQLSDESEGLSKLLECRRFDPSVTTSKTFVIQPGETTTEYLDRAEGAKYVGIVAGYFLLQKQQVVRLFPIPLVEKTRGLFNRSKIGNPGILKIGLYLGPQEILGIGRQ